MLEIFVILIVVGILTIIRLLSKVIKQNNTTIDILSDIYISLNEKEKEK